MRGGECCDGLVSHARWSSRSLSCFMDGSLGLTDLLKIWSLFCRRDSNAVCSLIPDVRNACKLLCQPKYNR